VFCSAIIAFLEPICEGLPVVVRARGGRFPGVAVDLAIFWQEFVLVYFEEGVGECWIEGEG
jgi:hypothetical protein